MSSLPSVIYLLFLNGVRQLAIFRQWEGGMFFKTLKKPKRGEVKMALQVVDLEKFPSEYFLILERKYKAWKRREKKKRARIEKILKERREK